MIQFATVPLLMILMLLSSCAQQITPKPNHEPTLEGPANIDVLQQQRQRRYHQAVALLAEGKHAEAESALRAFIDKYPDIASAYLNLAYALLNRQQPEKSLQAVDKSIELNPRIAQAYHHRAYLKLNNGDIHQAREDFQHAITLHPGYENAHFNLALLYDIYLQNINLAIKHYQSYLDLVAGDDERTREWVEYLKNSVRHGQ